MTLLGTTVGHPIGAQDLEIWPGDPQTTHVAYTTTELTAVCPVTRQPDIYTARITYPGPATIESKGLKHYLWGFRDTPIGCEALAARIARELTARLGQPVTVHLTQQVRGGLALSSEAVGP